MKKQQKNIYKVLLNNKRVNNYTKMLLVLNTLNYYGDDYIPNKKLMNLLKIHKKNVIDLLHKLEKDNVIKINYKGRKRFFVFKDFIEEHTIEERKKEIFEYNWLEEE